MSGILISTNRPGLDNLNSDAVSISPRSRFWNLKERSLKTSDAVLTFVRRIPPVRRLIDRTAAIERTSLLYDARGVGDFACTACREEVALTPFERRTDVHGQVYDLWMCLRCHAILNATHLRLVRTGDDFLSLQADASNNFYAVDDEYLSTVPDQIDACGFFDYLFSVYPKQQRGVMIDFGAGRGIVAGSGAKFFEKVYAAELSLNVLRQVHAVMPNRDRIFVTDDYRSIPDMFDCIASMHVLEHLPNLRDILEDLVARLNPGGSLFFQVPMLLRAHLVCVHYTFFTDVSARSLCRQLGLDVISISYDNDLDFLNCIARKPSSDRRPRPN